LRIDNSLRTGAAAARASARGATPGTTFAIDGEAQPARVANANAAVATASIDTLLALQGAEDAATGRKRQLRRGRSLLDALDALKLDLIAGRTSESHLNQLMAIIGQARVASEPGLDALLDDIELRARVELAKRGVFPR
jgi:hypothetical protein